jgi:hypothetical protein
MEPVVSLLPKEHGAYGQISFPLVAAFGVAGVSPAGALMAAAMVAGFLAHEPALVLLGLRGARAKRELWYRAAGWFACCSAVGAATVVGAWLTMEPAVRLSIAVPVVPAIVRAAEAGRGREKSWYGETAAALAFSGAAVPVAMAGGVPVSAAASIAIPFALLFVSSTLAVRVVILRVRRGGDVKAAAATRRAALSVAVIGSGGLALMSVMSVLPVSVIAAAAPGLLTAAVIALRPPAPAHLRPVGWTLVAISVLTTAIVVTAA